MAKRLTFPLFRQQNIQLLLRMSQTVFEKFDCQSLLNFAAISNSLQKERTILLKLPHYSFCCGNPR